ncbi:hypothetical protein [Staphylococcus auricularis]|uniref:hypothetical protein n=1 Tax=Staphylococcus auricularis TaxID=29379 RepID=UPI001F3A41F3|nr:hypothetical protein [Staphylococcus auricularis]MCE5038330.1 hypothetical protein [Staphylococcus auricularis]
MAHYNKDEHDRNVDTNDISSYLETYFHRDFVYGFLIGTAIGSVIGLVTTLKSKSKADTPSQAPEFNSKIIEQSNREKAIAQQNVEEINRLIDEANEESKHLDATGATAEQQAIQAESSEHGLATPAPEPQPEPKSEPTNDLTSDSNSDTSVEHIDESATPTSKEMTAQQDAIQEEAHDTNDAQEYEKGAGTNTSTGIAQAAKGKQQALANDDSVKSNTDNLLAEEKPQQAEKDQKAPNLVSGSSNESDSSEGLAQAAKGKQQALANDDTVKSNTDNLLAEEKPQQAEKDQKAPNLVTPTTKETTAQEGDVEGDTSVEHIDESANPTAKEIQAQQGAIQEEAEIQDEAEETNEPANATHELTTEGLTQAAKGKQQSLADDDTVKSNTADLLHEEKPSPAHSDYQVPHLVTQSDEDDLADVKAHSSDETPIYKKNKPAQQGEKSEGKIEKKSFDE